jgi:hypothetical protein
LSANTLTLRADRTTAAVWSVAALLLVAGSVWIVRDSRGALLAWIGFVLAIAVTAYFALQLVVPRALRLELDQDGIEGHLLGHTTRVRWDDVKVARVTVVAGDPILELHVRRDGDTEPVGVLLPLGCDLDALHAFLEARLGRTRPAPSGPAPSGPAPSDPDPSDPDPSQTPT